MIWKERFEIYAEKETNETVALEYRDAARAIATGSVAGIGSLRSGELSRQVNALLTKTAFDTRPAFPDFTIRIPNPVKSGTVVTGFFKNVGKFFKRVVKGIGDAFKKFVNWIFKGIGKKNGALLHFYVHQEQRPDPQPRNPPPDPGTRKGLRLDSP